MKWVRTLGLAPDRASLAQVEILQDEVVVYAMTKVRRIVNHARRKEAYDADLVHYKDAAHPCLICGRCVFYSRNGACVECNGKKARAAYAAFKEKYPTSGKRARIIHL
jgi:hypothetical protein